MKIVTLIDNLAYKKSLIGEHGFSLYIEKDNTKILFDTGQSDRIIHNANVLGIDLSKIDFVILSHGHFDHTGGLKSFLEINKKAKIILKRDALQNKYKKNNFIGFTFNFEIFRDRFMFLENDYPIDNETIVVKDIEIHNENDTHFDEFYIVQENNKKEDDFSDELFLFIKKDNKVNIISACSHRGITNIIENVKKRGIQDINFVIGGFHISNEKFENILKIAEYFDNNNISRIATSHCTGVESYAILKRYLKEKIFYNFCGNEIII